MKLFHFTSNGYGEHHFVCAQNLSDAIRFSREAVEKVYQDQIAAYGEERKKYPPGQSKYFDEQEGFAKDQRDRALVFIDACVNKTGLYPGDDSCSVDEHPVGHVIFSEVC